MTAVEWLKNQYNDGDTLYPWDFAYAFELEEKQIIDAYEANSNIQTSEEYFEELKNKPSA